MRECVVIPTTVDRSHYLHCALRRIREQDPKIEIAVFLDRCDGGGADTYQIAGKFHASLYYVGRHTLYGNSLAALTALQWALVTEDFDLIHYCESDTMMHPDCLAWHREIHADMPNIFAACGWVCNLHAPIEPDLALVPWYYAPNASFKRDKLALIVKHAIPEYFQDMRGYVLKTFPNSILHNRGAQTNTQFFEQDGLIQYVLMEDKSQVAWRGTALVDHVGVSGYNRPSGLVFEGTLDERVTKVESLIADAHWRAELFGRAIVEREIGHKLRKREYVYSIRLPGGWTSELVSELKLEQLPRRLNSVPMPRDAVITGSLRM
jgi:hypothetical protein